MNQLSNCTIFLGLIANLVISSSASVSHPDLKAIGQVFGTYTDDTLAEAYKKFAMTLGETEIDLNATLNPYFIGAFVLTIDGDGGIEMEEAYASMIHGLPLNLTLKIGKYRLNFGKLNQIHPHAYPFIRTPRVLAPEIAQLLPGVESFNDIAAEISTLIPVFGNWIIVPSADFLEGRSFHPDEAAIRHGWLAHVSNTFSTGPALFDIGASVTQGINNVETNNKTTIFGFDAKTEIIVTSAYTLTIGSELLYKNANITDTAGQISSNRRYGIYAYVNNHFHSRFNAGLLYERYENPGNHSSTDRSVKSFTGFEIFEESTVIRASYEYFFSGDNLETNTFEVQLLFSMGKHKEHQH